MSVVVTRAELVQMREQFRHDGKIIVFTNGCFDIVHRGHVDYLTKAKALGDVLLVGMNTDASVRRLKGTARPIVCQDDRAFVLAAFRVVDYICLFDEDTPLQLIQAIKPDILVKGEDYRLDQVVGREVVESYGGRVCLVPLLQGYSTTQIAEKIASTQQN